MSITIKNFNAVLAGLTKETELYEAASGYAIGKMALEVERKAKLNASTGSHKRGTKREAGGGDGPNVITGNLRRSIKTELRQGFGSYVATVGPTMIYARQVELGGGRWKSGVKYPYLKPALDELQSSGALQRVFLTAFRSKMRGR